jgi:hypothetical protein
MGMRDGILEEHWDVTEPGLIEADSKEQVSNVRRYLSGATFYRPVVSFFALIIS